MCWLNWAQITAPKWLEKHASLLIASLLNSETSPRTTVQSFISQNLLSCSVKNVFFWGGGADKSLVSLFIYEEAEEEGRLRGDEEREKRGTDGGWKWWRALVLCECLCAAFAKKNKA